MPVGKCDIKGIVFELIRSDNSIYFGYLSFEEYYVLYSGLELSKTVLFRGN